MISDELSEASVSLVTIRCCLPMELELGMMEDSRSVLRVTVIYSSLVYFRSNRAKQVNTSFVFFHVL